LIISLRDFSVGDAFVGYHEDTIPSIVMQVCNDLEEEGEDGPVDPWEIKVSAHLLMTYCKIGELGKEQHEDHSWDKFTCSYDNKP